MGPIRTPRKSRRVLLRLEQLEDRLVPATLEPTALEQVLLEQLNDARADPAGYGRSIGLDLSAVAPAQALAWDWRLIAASRGHSQDMNLRDYFAHTNANGWGPGQRIANEGYLYAGWGESIAAGYSSTSAALKGLIIDEGIADLGHRRHLLAIDAVFKNHTQVGIGIVTGGSGTYSHYYTIDTAAPRGGGQFLTGVVFNDANRNGKYDVGEGLGGVTITVQGVGSTFSFGSGGYGIALAPGTYTVTAAGGGLNTSYTQTVTIGSSNQRLRIIQSSGGTTSSSPSPEQAVTAAQHAANLAVVQQLYATYLRRLPTAVEANLWTVQLDRGQASAESMTSQIKGSQEFRGVGATWLRQAYRDMLGREIDSGETAGWLAYLQGSGSMDAVAHAIATSQEHRQLEWAGWVRDVYQTYLRRGAGQGEIGYWVGYFQAGWTKDSLVGAVVGSAEYQGRVGSGNSEFVGALYRDILGRSAASVEIAGWANALSAGASRGSVVGAFLGSLEYRWKRHWDWAGRLYAACLGRPADALELTAMTTALSGGANPMGIVVSVLTSQEYYNRAAR